MRITDDHFAHWQEHGYVVVENFLTPDELAAAQAGVLQQLPTWDEYAADPERHPRLRQGPMLLEFPFASLDLNLLCVHPEASAFAERAIGTADLFCTQSILWGKYAGTLDFDQELHIDFDNNSLAVPRDDGGFRQVPMLLYLSDVTIDLGPTHVVSRVDSGVPELTPRHRSREQHPHLYEAEHAHVAPAGSLLIYGMRVLHRGSRMLATAGARWSYHFVYRASGMEWMGFNSWARHGGHPHMDRFMEAATPRQRSLVGFPAPGHPYWNDETIAGVAERYPGMDMSPYSS